MCTFPESAYVRILRDNDFWEHCVEAFFTVCFLHTQPVVLSGYNPSSQNDALDDRAEQNCYCRGTDVGAMIACDSKTEWFHTKCL